VQPDTELLGNPQRVVALGLVAVLFPDGVGVALHAEAREEVDALHVDALLHDDLCRQHGVETARN
jgi:hypothetical protein